MSDLIDRQAAIDAMSSWDWQELYLPIHFKQLLEELPSAQPDVPDTNVGDLISRQAAIDALKEEEYPCESDYDEGYMAALDKAVWIIERWLPSAQPERKKGKWIADSGMIYCHECRYGYDGIFKRYYNFCPNCGADMEVE